MEFICEVIKENMKENDLEDLDMVKEKQHGQMEAIMKEIEISDIRMAKELLLILMENSFLGNELILILLPVNKAKISQKETDIVIFI